MTSRNKPRGDFFSWTWGDTEIENSKILRKQLLDIISQGFSGVLVTLRQTRYEFTDPKVLRMIAQASQWAKRRDVEYWIHTDPRQASRSFLTRTGERTQYLITTQDLKNTRKRIRPNLAPVVKNQFRLQYHIPRNIPAPILQEGAICFEPSGLERAFIFQIIDNQICLETLRDITSVSHFYTNMQKGITEVFGTIQAPDDESWQVLAFPRFDTNLYDYAGRNNNDLFNIYIEDLFDACTHLNGVTWGQEQSGYGDRTNLYPVSLSLYNSFIAEFGYDLRDVLYALVLPVDNASHIPIRCDYNNLLIDVIVDAQKSYHQMVHSFFTGVQFGTHFPIPVDDHGIRHGIHSALDPWRELDPDATPIVDLTCTGHPYETLSSILPEIIIAKSLCAHSPLRIAFMNVVCKMDKLDWLAALIHLFGLYSLHWITGDRHHSNSATRVDNLSQTAAASLCKINQQWEAIQSHTGLLAPEADIVMIKPVETLLAQSPKDAEKMLQSVHNLMIDLILSGYQIDMISSHLLKKGQRAGDRLQIGKRVYSGLIYPHPDIVDSTALDLLTSLDRTGFPILFGDECPQRTSAGKSVARISSEAFDMSKNTVETIKQRGLEPLLHTPKGTLGTVIPQIGGNLILLCPTRMDGSDKGRVQYRDKSFEAAVTKTLSIYWLTEDGKAEKLL